MKQARKPDRTSGAARRRLALSLAALLGTGAAAVPGQAEAAAQIRLYLDGQALVSEAPPYIVPKADVTMVPLRVVSEGLGASVSWSAKERRADIAMSGSEISLVMGQSYATVNGARVKLDASVQMKQSRTMVPLRFVGEQLGLGVAWSSADRTVKLTSPGGEPGATPGTTPGPGATPSPSPNPSATPAPSATPGTNPVPSATPSPTPGQVVPGPGAPAKLRGTWVSTVYNLDWPSAASAKSNDSAKQKLEFTALLDELQAMGMNAAFVQVRPAGDALYPTLLSPWSAFLTGKQGLKADYDPLAFMIDEAHRRGMELHAWFNPFRAASTADPAQLDAGSIVRQHPEWIVNSGGKLYVNPGIPAARQAVIDAIVEVAARYDVDGIHLDDYFYPSGSAFDDEGTYKLYSAGTLLSKGDWRRGNINAFVEQLDRAVHAAKPSIRFGISPFGVWRNQSTDPSGSETKAGVTAYDSMYADVRLWVQKGWLDYVAPQIYWSFAHPTVPYGKVADWWQRTVRGTGVDLYIGHSPYKLGTTEAGWQSSSEIVRQLDYNQLAGSVTGELFFSAKDLRRNPLGIADALRSYYAGAQ
ncbi:family 10 glycosylhydrolase [Paenibacillus sp. FSL W8-1187]|uniref:Putative glycoside hydrolase n=1 Tax=Paenibacillus pasadenensis TaxID=217090 RepID=A0A2N5N064_9BACL|nr:family 10 glycosylhydrolase [Paenibacillus pasadenensis]PLT43724.1 putative glycoside hydrolase [Paenibacillus pasadenensis]